MDVGGSIAVSSSNGRMRVSSPHALQGCSLKGKSLYTGLELFVSVPHSACFCPLQESAALLLECTLSSLAKPQRTAPTNGV